MKITDDQFFKAKNDKNLNAFMLMRIEGRDFIRLCFTIKMPYSDSWSHVATEYNTEISIDNFSGYNPIGDTFHKQEINKICFHESIYRATDRRNHIETFLDHIKKDSHLKFKVVAFNSCDALRKVGMTSHQLYGIIDKKTYFLSSYTGTQNLGSPINPQ